MPRSVRLTYITIDEKFDIGIVGPYNGVNTVREVLPEEPEAQECDAKVPTLPDEAREQDQE